MSNTNTNNKTTTLGILTILSAAIGGLAQYLSTGHLDLAPILGSVTAGVGLIHAKDDK